MRKRTSPEKSKLTPALKRSKAYHDEILRLVQEGKISSTYGLTSEELKYLKAEAAKS